jgi:hypothetical protein
MTVLFLVWRELGRRWWPIGCLSERPAAPAGGRLYAFRYTKGALDATAAGFVPLPGFPELGATYVSSELFPIFRNRVMSSERSEFGTFLRWLDLPPGETDPSFSSAAVVAAARRTCSKSFRARSPAKTSDTG